jgi:ribonuclease J
MVSSWWTENVRIQLARSVSAHAVLNCEAEIGIDQNQAGAPFPAGLARVLCATMNPSHEDLWFLPLGGCGEIGMNLNLYGHDGRWLMVDCGVTFAGPDETGPHVQMADPKFIAERREQLTALVITHAHEDHVGAVAHLWRQLRCPVYTTAFTAEILRRKLAEAGLLGDVQINVVRSGARLQLDVFTVEWIGLTHSTPETQALLIQTPVGSIFHTADWKLDATPVVGAAYDEARLRALAEEEILAMVCDSTNALVAGRSISEGALYTGLRDLVAVAPGRVVVGCFGSNIARLHTLALIARETGRYAALLGRSLGNYLSAARSAGIWDENLRFIDARHVGYLPPEEVLVIATGSQGERGAALQRLASNNHPDLNLSPGDTVLMSARVIPGNEPAVNALTDRLATLQVNVVKDEELNVPIHASGHPASDELRDLYTWVNPQVAIPVHGENEHMKANAELARDAGVPRQLVGENGDLFMLSPNRGIRRKAVPVGRLGLEERRLCVVRE